MLKSHLILIIGLLAFTANTVRMTAQIIRYKKDTQYNIALNKYLRNCWNAERQENLSTDMCVESKFWGEESEAL